jgi:hypothetical protein
MSVQSAPVCRESRERRMSSRDLEDDARTLSTSPRQAYKYSRSEETIPARVIVKPEVPLSSKVAIPAIPVPVHHQHDLYAVDGLVRLRKIQSMPSISSQCEPAVVLQGSSSAPLFDSRRKEDPIRIQKRMARKAELARASRLRKKNYVQDLEEKVEKLGKKISDLEAKIEATAKTSSKSCGISGVSEYSISDINLLSERELSEVLSRLQASTNENLGEVFKLAGLIRSSLVPTLQEKFLLWALDQSDGFYEGGGLWNNLVRSELGITEDIAMLLMSKGREMSGKIKYNLDEVFYELIEFQSAVGEYQKQMDMLIEGITSVMTPRQLAKFIVWVNNNQSYMQMLDTIWNDFVAGMPTAPAPGPPGQHQYHPFKSQV